MATTLKGRVTHTAHTLVIVFFLYDSWKLFFDIHVDKVNQHLDLDFLVHNGKAAVIFVTSLNESWKENLFHFLVMEICDGETTKFLNDGTLALAQ